MKLNTIIQSAKEVTTGWEKVVSLPLLNITKGVLLWLKHFDSFWADFDDHNKYLKPEGCVQVSNLPATKEHCHEVYHLITLHVVLLDPCQFVFDLHFVAQFASNGDFSSKFLRSIVSDLIFLVQDIYAENDSDFQRCTYFLTYFFKNEAVLIEFQ